MAPLLFPLVIFGAMYFLMIRPQIKRQKQHMAMIKELGTGEWVVTRGGLIGKITAVTEKTFKIEIANGTHVKVFRSFVEGKYDPTTETSTITTDLKEAA